MNVSVFPQPDYIYIDEILRLAKFHDKYDFALKWYQDLETLILVDGKKTLYDEAKLKRMYYYLNNKGELYFIEFKVENKYIPIGDVTFSKEDMPIVIGNKNYRHKGIGFRVILTLAKRAKFLGYDKIYVNEIYHYNIGSQKTFEKVGFKKYKKTAKGFSYILNLKNNPQLE
ncbi:GNAT family N-acetyltransferase [Clostridium felsineum]|uniref:GNAT family N-acetyltransferase n=1 Tax=Clostridium felsineum TaxID=36839 RepID=UPI00098C3DD0|nr:GNAT family N-acetyltransferase [Clostridium felsineum]URZ03111.1 hypothetical protein CLAUR_031570 [Clostridium felsineum]